MLPYPNIHHYCSSCWCLTYMRTDCRQGEDKVVVVTLLLRNCRSVSFIRKSIMLYRLLLQRLICLMDSFFTPCSFMDESKARAQATFIVIIHYVQQNSQITISVSAWPLSTGLQLGESWKAPCALTQLYRGEPPLTQQHNQKNLISVDQHSPIFRNMDTFIGKTKGASRKCSNERENATAGRTQTRWLGSSCSLRGCVFDT